MKGIKSRLSILGFLEFAVWGSYLISMGMYLGSVGLGANIFWFYTVQGLVSLFMPALIGILADRFIPAQKMLSICHVIAGASMIAAGWYCMDCMAAAGPDAVANPVPFGPLFALYTLSVAFFMPTIGLNNSVAFNALTKSGLDTVKDFPPIRVWGTVGFIAAELMVNFIAIPGYVGEVLNNGLVEITYATKAIQYSYIQFFMCGLFSLILAAYSLTMPNCPVNKNKKAGSLAEALGLNAFKLFKQKKMAIFFLFSMLLGVSLQLTNAYGTPFIQQFQYAGEEFNNWFSDNPTFLISISQCAEALCILGIAFCLKRFGIKGVMLMAMFAWVLRFGFFGLGDTNFPGIILLVLSCIVYGVAFDFFNVSGGIYVDQQTDVKMRSSAQGLFMMMTNGIGASLGTFIAGTFVVNPLTEDKTGLAKLEGFQESWLIFAAYALVVFVAFYFCFHDDKKGGKNAVKVDPDL